MESTLDRRRFLTVAAGVAAGVATGALLPAGASPAPGTLPRAPLFGISLAQWSLHRTLRAGALDTLGFPQHAKRLGIAAVEYVNTFWQQQARDAAFLAELRRRCDTEGVQSLLIMCDGEGALGDPDARKRTQAIANHHRWIDAAKALGCHCIRVNAHSEGSPDEQQRLAGDGLHRLCEYGDRFGIDVVVENHGGLSSNGAWLVGTLRRADHPRCGSLPDFGNFRVDAQHTYDRYLGVDELMPFARAVSAKSHDFGQRGDEIHTDYARMLDLVVGKHGWREFVGIEYEGDALSEDDGIAATKRLLERERERLQRRLGDGGHAREHRGELGGKGGR